MRSATARIGDVAGDGKDVGIVGRLDRTRVGDDAIAAVAECLDEAGADALGCAGDDGDFAWSVHGDWLEDWGEASDVDVGDSDSPQSRSATPACESTSSADILPQNDVIAGLGS